MQHPLVAHDARSAAGRDGMTLVELLVVLTVIAVISGVAVGMIRRGDGGLGVEANAGLLRSTLRLARESARRSDLGAIVRVVPEERLLEIGEVTPAGVWHFEDEFGSGRVPAQLGGRLVEEGRLGRALELNGAGADLGSRAAHQPVHGMRISFDVRLLSANSGRLCERQGTFALSVDSEGALAGELRVGEQSESVRVETRPGLLVPGAWARVAMVYDRAELRLEVDGVVQARAAEIREVARSPKAHLTLGGQGLQSLIDTLRYDVVAEAASRSLEGGVLVFGVAERSLDEAASEAEAGAEAGAAADLENLGEILIRFDGRGGLHPLVHDRPVRIGLKADDGDPDSPREVVVIETSGVIR